MTQKHVDLLMEAVNLTEEQADRFLCNRIGYITGFHTVRELRNTVYTVEHYYTLTEAIQKNIEENIFYVAANGTDTFDNTTFHQQGMTRKEWAETILAPLALELEEN